MILIAMFVCMQTVHDFVESERLIGGQIAQERNIIEFGEKVLNKTEESEQKRMPDWNNWREAISYNDNDAFFFGYLNYNKNVSGQLLEDLSPHTVLIAQRGNGMMTNEEFEQFIKFQVTDEAFFMKTCSRDYQLLYTADSKVVVYIKQKDEYRYFDSNKIVKVQWIP
ncbi:MAG: hypothetical protein KAS23_17365 [Anaerohalosphaera sp.]|nr:hypothetical protein [Anaerohalosphaera sp.]